jgi:hypothetical protein
MIKNLVVCGDSFNSISFKEEYKGTHWSEILSKKLKLNLINLAEPGCSTRMVAFQILESLNYDNSLVIAMLAASFQRFEILTDPNFSLNENITLKNFVYRSEDKNNFNRFIRSINSPEFSINRLVQKYLTTKVSWGLMKEIDNWALFYSLSKLKRKKVKFLLLDGIHFQNLKSYDLEEYVEVFGENYIIKNEVLSFKDYVIDKMTKDGEWFAKIDPGYHTFPEDQIKIATILEHEIINRKFYE